MSESEAQEQPGKGCSTNYGETTGVALLFGFDNLPLVLGIARMWSASSFRVHKALVIRLSFLSLETNPLPFHAVLSGSG
jgi:hypothetical protein